MATYKPGIPTGTVDLDVDYLNIQGNFTQANTSFGINHYPFDDGSPMNGKHKFVGMPVTTTPGTVANEGALYTKASVGGTALFFARDVASDVQMTTASVSAPLNAQNGYTWLPGGLFMQWGTTSPASSANVQPVNFSLQFDTTAYNVQVTGLRAASSPGTTDCWAANITNAGFDVFNNGGHTFQFMWVAIGKRV